MLSSVIAALQAADHLGGTLRPRSMAWAEGGRPFGPESGADQNEKEEVRAKQLPRSCQLTLDKQDLLPESKCKLSVHFQTTACINLCHEPESSRRGYYRSKDSVSGASHSWLFSRLQSGRVSPCTSRGRGNCATVGLFGGAFIANQVLDRAGKHLPGSQRDVALLLRAPRGQRNSLRDRANRFSCYFSHLQFS